MDSSPKDFFLLGIQDKIRFIAETVVFGNSVKWLHFESQKHRQI